MVFVAFLGVSNRPWATHGGLSALKMGTHSFSSTIVSKLNAIYAPMCLWQDIIEGSGATHQGRLGEVNELFCVLTFDRAGPCCRG